MILLWYQTHILTNLNSSGYAEIDFWYHFCLPASLVPCVTLVTLSHFVTNWVTITEAGGAKSNRYCLETAQMAAPGLWSGQLSVAHSPVPRVQLCPPVLCNAQYTLQLRRARSEPRRMSLSLSLSLCLSPGLSPLSTHNLHTGHTITVLCTLLRQIR